MKKLFTLIAMLACVVSGAWAEDITSLPFSADFASSTSPFDAGDIPTASGNYIGGYLRVTNTTSTAWFDSDTSTEGRQALNLASNQEITVSAQAYHGWNDAGKDCTVALVNDGGYTIASYTYNTKSCKITDVKLGGETASSFTAFNGQSRYSSTKGANGLMNNNRNAQYFVSTANYNPQITFKVSGSGAVSVRIQIGLTNVDKTFSTTLNTSSFSMNLAKIVITSGETNEDRTIGIDNLSITSKTIAGYTSCKINQVVGSDIIKTYTIDNVVIGSTVSATAEQMATFYNNDASKKYVFNSTATTATSITTVADAASNVINLQFDAYNKYNYTAHATDGTNTIAENIVNGNVYTDNTTAKYYIPAAILSGNTLFFTTKDSYTKNVTIASDGQDDAYTYNASSLNNVCFFAEAEDLAGTSTSSPNDNLKYLASNGKMGRGTNITVTTLPAGMYRITCKYINTNSSAQSVTFVAGETQIYTNTNVTVRPTLTTNIFVLDEETTIKFTATASSTSGIDYIYIEKLPATVPVTISAAGYATFVTPYPVDFKGNTIEAYAVSEVNSAEGTVTLTKVTTVPEGQAVIVKGTTGNVDVVANAGSITNLMMAAAADIAYDSKATNTNYVLAKVDGNVGLYPVNSGTIAAGKGYLPVAKNNAAKGGFTFVTDDVTAANVVEAAPAVVKNGKFATADGIVIVKDGVKYNVAGMKK